MSKHLRKIILPVLCAVTLLCGIFGITACGKKPKPEAETYTVTISDTEHGTVTADCYEASAGTTVNLTVTPDDNYYLDSLTVNGSLTEVSGGKASFTMPEADVTVSAVFIADGNYAVRVGSFGHISIKADKTTAEEGQTVTLTVSVDYGYQITELKMNGTALTVSGGKAEFTMPAAAAVITASAGLVPNAKTGSAVGDFELSAKIMNDTANSYWSTSYGADALEVSVYVKDGNVSAAKDAVELYVGRYGYEYTKLSAVNFGIKVSADGAAVQYAVSGDEYVSADENAFTVTEATPWSENGADISGYFVKVSIPYEKLGFSGTPNDGEITLLPVLSNYTNTMGASAIYNGATKTNPATYPVLKNGVLEENYYAQGTGTLGGMASVPASNGWDLSKDYAPQDTANYPNREAVLNATTPDDDLLFFRNEGADVYAEATFRATGVKNNEKLGKFGLMLFDGASKNGVFFYVEADANGSAASSITGTGLGYTLTNNNNYLWGHDHVITDAYRYDREITLKMAYVAERGYLYVYYTPADGGEDVLVETIRYKASHDVTIGFKSFNIDLVVTNYFCTNDLENEDFAAHVPAPRFMGNNLGGTEENADFGSRWDISKDYKADASNYADREVKLTGHDGADNNLYFIATEGKAAYVRATFKVDEVLNGEMWGKFGLMLFDGASNRGTFFYVDAWVGETADGVIRGRQLGYNYSPNGAWNVWSTFNKAGDVFDLSTKTITLAMSFKNSVLSLYYENAQGQDVLVSQLVYVTQSDYFIIGIKSFAIAMTVTDYTAITDTNDAEFAAHAPAIVQQNIDVLFAGDSYMEFWKNYGVWNNLTADLTSAGAKLENIGIGGTKVPEWDNGGMTGALQMQYNTQKIVFHIGVNDIDGGVSVNDTYNNIVSLFTNYHSAFPQADIYWVSLIPNNFYIKNGGTYNEEYKQLNQRVKAYMESISYLHYIDVETPFTDENGEARTNLFMGDGLHLNPVYGYPLWTSIIKQAMGYPAPSTSEILGNLDGSGIQRTATPGWSYGTNGNIAEISTDVVYGQTVLTEEAVFYKGLYAADILFEADIRSSDRFFPDNASKPGVMLVNDQFTLFAYLTTNYDEWQNNGKTVQWFGLLYRNNVHNGDSKPVGVADWNWSTLSSYDIQIPAINICDDFHKLGIAKLGSTIYLLLDGKVVRECTVPGVTADMKFSAGVMTFNRYMEVRSVNAVSGATDVEMAMAESHAVNVPNYEGVTITADKTSAKKTQTVTFTVDNGDSVIDKVYVVYGGNEHALTANNGVYSFVMPDEEVTIQITFVGKMSVTLGDGLIDKLDASSLSVTQGHTVTFTAKSGYVISKLYATGSSGTTEIVPNNGVYTLTVNEDVTITGEFFEVINGIVYDGALTADEGWTNEILAKAAVENFQNTNIQVVGRTAEAGIVLGFIVKHEKPVNEKLQGGPNDEGWHLYLNFEVRLNNNDNVAIQANFLGYAVNCKVAYSTIANPDNDGYNYLSVMEMVVPHSLFNTNTASRVTMALGGVYGDRFTWLFNIDAISFNWTVTHEGMEYTASPAVLDGVFDDAVWTNEVKANTYSAVALGASVSFMAVKATNGVMIGVTVNHTVSLMTAIQQDGSAWWHFMGPEIRLFQSDVQIAASANGQTKFCSANRRSITNADGSYTTTFEMFVPYFVFGNIDTSGNIPFVAAGVYEIGWTLLYGSADWSNFTHYITDKGLVSVPKNVAGANLDGKLDDALWTAEVMSAEHTLNFNVNSSKVVVNGVKADGGVLLGVKINTNKSAVECQNSNRTDWAAYQHLRLNLFAVVHEVFCPCPCLSAIFDQTVTGSQFGFFETDNGAGAEYRYTSTYEIYIPYTSYEGQDTSGNIPLTLIVSTDVYGLTACGQTDGDLNFFQISGYFTANGMVSA